MKALFALLVLLASLTGGLAPALAQQVSAEHVSAVHVGAEQVGHVNVGLVSERTRLQVGADNTVALRIRPDPGWHVYWRNPGDSGLPTTLRWRLPEGVRAGPLQWPYPHAQRVDATITNYGYEGEVLLPVTLDVAAPLAGTSLTLTAEASWLVCSDVCIPGKATLTLTRPVQAGIAPPDANLVRAFATTHAALPAPLPATGTFQIDDHEVRLSVAADAFEAGQRVAFFPYDNALVAHAAAQRVRVGAGQLTLAQARSPYFTRAPAQIEGVLVIAEGETTRAYALQADAGRVAPLPESIRAQSATSPAQSSAAPAPGANPTRLPLMLLLAFAGGLILNLMPCVFPVLSIKAMALAQSAGHARAHQRAGALAYTAGVVLSFLAVAGLLLALRAGGAQLGWGFQLQSPVFVALLAYVLFALGLSMSGVVEFGTRWMGAGQSLAARPGHSGSFFTGVLAVLVASPCTAPFMGAALGFALTQPAAVALLVFAALGLGLAAPFLAIGFIPALARRLPRPGAWMATFRQAMAFPLYLTVVWLLWVLARQAGADAVGLALTGLTLLAFALWLSARRQRVVPLLSGVLALTLLAHPVLRAAPPAAAASFSTSSNAAAAEAVWQPYAPQRVAALTAAGRTVFVDFTADWCLTCKVNERTTLSSERVLAGFAAHDVALLKGDWTRYDPVITAALAAHGRSGVPMYLLVHPDGRSELLPQILTPERVLTRLAPP